MGVRGVLLLLVVVELWGLGGLLVAAVPPPPLPIRPILLCVPPVTPLHWRLALSSQPASQPAGWLAGWLADWLAARLAGCGSSSPARWLAGWLVGWLHLEGFLATQIDFQVCPLEMCPKVLQNH